MTAVRQRDVPVVDEDEAELPIPLAAVLPAGPTARDLLDANPTVHCSFQQLAAAVHETFYPAIHLRDKAGVARVGRATARLVEKLPEGSVL